MVSEVDHVFMCVSAGGEVASALTEFGLTEGTPNVHPGQGTACRRFFFANSYLELLWVNNPGEAQSETTQPTYLWERWTGRASGVCPLGFGFRSKVHGDGCVPFISWEYRPAYLPAPLSIHVGSNASALSEPMLFYLPFAKRPDAYLVAKRQPLHHRAGLHEVTRVALAGLHADGLSPELTAVTGAGLLGLSTGSAYLVEIGFDGESQGQHRDFRPMLPLLFRW
jgi:hypothetical protein